jgi:hypothetical protein
MAVTDNLSELTLALQTYVAVSPRPFAVSDLAAAALKRLARYAGETQRATLERLITSAESDVVDKLSSAAQKAYYDLTK